MVDLAKGLGHVICPQVDSYDPEFTRLGTVGRSILPDTYQ